MTLAWNLVSKHLHPHQPLQARIRMKIGRLEQHLQHFPPETVHLLVHLEGHPRTSTFTAALTLRLPSNILHSSKHAANPGVAFDAAMKALMRELESLKSELSREAQWRRKSRRAELRATKPLRFAAEPEPSSASTLAETLGEMIRRYYGRLLYHVQRELHRAQVDGEIPAGAIKAEVVMDEVVQQALSRPDRKPDDVSYRLWLHCLARRELKRRYRQIRVDGARNLPLDEDVFLPSDEPQGYDSRRTNGEPGYRAASGARRDLVMDEHAASPDEVAAEHDLVEYLHHVTAQWPDKERAVFDLHFLEGFDEAEVALLENLKPTQARSMIAEVQGRLRDTLRQAVGRRAEARPQVTA